jgi:hypothetical protein
MGEPQAIIDALKLITEYCASIPASVPVHPPAPVNTVDPPYGVISTVLSIFGLNWDGSDDKGDQDAAGNPLLGAWGAVTHNKTIVGCALPSALLKATFGGTAADHIKGYTCEIYSLVTQKTVVACDIVDIGPSSWTHRLLDGTYGLHAALGHIEHGTAHYGSFSKWPAGFHVAYWINDPNGKAVEIKGVDWSKSPVIVLGS